MSKIICDICGTTYPDTADCCPICGCSRDAAASLLGDDLLMEEVMEEPRTKGGRFSSNKKKKEIFDYDEANSPPEDEPVPEEGNPYEEEEEYEEEYAEADDEYDDPLYKDIVEFVVKTATEHGYLAEQVDNSTMQAKWVIGLGWSHAMFIDVLQKLYK